MVPEYVVFYIILDHSQLPRSIVQAQLDAFCHAFTYYPARNLFKGNLDVGTVQMQLDAFCCSFTYYPHNLFKRNLDVEITQGHNNGGWCVCRAVMYRKS